MERISTVSILDVPMFVGCISDAVEVVLKTFMETRPKKPLLISITGAHGLVTSWEDHSFSALLSSFFMNLPDGRPSVWVGWLKGAKSMSQCRGSDFFEALMKSSASLGIRHFLCGGKEGVAETLKQVVQKKFNNDKVVGTFSPPFRPMTLSELQELGRRIDMLSTDIVWIGISTPKQERLAVALAEHCKSSFIVTVGAAFDFHIGAVPLAPEWVQKAGLEWFFRLVSEPKRLWKRYAEIVPKFIFFNLLDFVRERRGTISRRKRQKT